MQLIQEDAASICFHRKGFFCKERRRKCLCNLDSLEELKILIRERLREENNSSL